MVGLMVNVLCDSNDPACISGLGEMFECSWTELAKGTVSPLPFDLLLL